MMFSVMCCYVFKASFIYSGLSGQNDQHIAFFLVIICVYKSIDLFFCSISQKGFKTKCVLMAKTLFFFDDEKLT